VLGGSDSLDPSIHTNEPNPLASAELYAPGTSSLDPAPPMTMPRVGPTATLLPSGEVLVVGGNAAGLNGNETVARTELYRECPVCEVVRIEHCDAGTDWQSATQVSLALRGRNDQTIVKRGLRGIEVSRGGHHDQERMVAQPQLRSQPGELLLRRGERVLGKPSISPLRER